MGKTDHSGMSDSGSDSSCTHSDVMPLDDIMALELSGMPAALMLKCLIGHNLLEVDSLGCPLEAVEDEPDVLCLSVVGSNVAGEVVKSSCEAGSEATVDLLDPMSMIMRATGVTGNGESNHVICSKVANVSSDVVGPSLVLRDLTGCASSCCHAEFDKCVLVTATEEGKRVCPEDGGIEESDKLGAVNAAYADHLILDESTRGMVTDLDFNS